MLKPGQKRPNTPNNSKSPVGSPDPDALPLPHWRQGVRETVLSTATDGSLNFAIEGGSDNGEFAYVGEITQNKVNYASGRLEEGEVVLEIQGQKVAGYTQRDVVAWLHHCCRNGNPVVLKTVSTGKITKDLRQFLNTRFQKGSVDHELQNTIRDNLYLRTVPVTTRVPREGEVNGVDYTFLSPDEFLALERSGNLLESGIYEGNHYGTPKPSKEPPAGSAPNSGSTGNLNCLIGGFFPGAHPSSEGKRKRNRSNVEAMAAKSMDPEPCVASDTMLGSQANLSNSSEPPPMPTSPPSYNHASECPDSPRADLGPLPSNWEKAYTERGEVYFIDHNCGTSHWLDPRLSKFQKKSLEECLDDELPYGWEKIEDPHYGTYYIDHVNRKTQYENPVIQAKRAAQGSGPALLLNESEPSSSYLPGLRKSQNMNCSSRANGSNMSASSKHSNNHERPFFTRNPNELQGEKLQSSLVKSARGLGFTIIGGDDCEEEFLQIKSVVPHAPAWLEGKLQTGDVLVYVNTTCVLGFTHHDMVSMFQSIAPGETVTLEVCRGYPLPFDPNDPNTEVVTTVAVNAPDCGEPTDVYVDRDGNVKADNFFDIHNGSEDLVNSSVKSMPDLCTSDKIKNLQRPNSTDVLLNDSSDNVLNMGDFADSSFGKPEFLSIFIVKGAMGFGFTIADSAYGQKVKKILDRQRCKNLMEGDILVDINNINVRNMCHSEVVQVLKDCQRNQEASVTVQRGGLASPGKAKPRRKDEPASPRKTIYKDNLLGLYRSKTPTADLYSTQPKEVIPNRPKTPLVDTRNRPKTPTSAPTQRPWTPSDNNSNVDFVSNLNKSKVSNVADKLSPELSPTSMYKDTFTYGYGHMSEGQVNYGRSRSPGQELDYADNMPHSPGMFPASEPARCNNRSPCGEYFGQYSSQPFFNGYGGAYESSYSYGETLPKDYSFHQASGLPAGSIPPSSSGYYTSDSLGRRKESTSFEHEQPHPSTVTRLSRDLRWPAMGPAVRVYPAGPGMEWVETVATLVRQESGFGFRIVGGTEEGSQVSIGHIVPGGAADLDGRLCTGDEIVSVDCQNVLSTSHHHVVQLMGKAASNGRVSLGIRRRVPTHELQNYTKPEVGYPFDVTVTRRENEGFGFVIISSVNKAGSTIGRIIEGSPAERCGQLHVGDRILAVNHMDIVNLHHGDIVNLIKDSGYTVTLTIGPPLDDSSSTASASQRIHLSFPKTSEERWKALRQGFPANGSSSGKVDGRTRRMIVNWLCLQLNEEEDGIEEYHAVELSRGKRGFGFSIRGGREFQNMPLFVLQIADNGPASMDNRLRVGDQIIEINGINTKSMTHAEAIEIIRNGGPCVRLLVKRGGKIPAVITEGGGMRPGSSLSQPSSGPATLTPASALNGPGCWEHFPPPS